MTATLCTAADPAEAAHPRVGELIDHWRRMAPGPGRLPGRQHFDPLAADGRNVDMLLGITMFYWNDGRVRG